MARLSVFAKMFQSRLVRLRHNVHFVFLSGIFDFNHGAPRLTLTVWYVAAAPLELLTKFYKAFQFHNKPKLPTKIWASIPISGGLTMIKIPISVESTFNNNKRPYMCSLLQNFEKNCEVLLTALSSRLISSNPLHRKPLATNYSNISQFLQNLDLI